jgi:arylsulfatase A-like enzyme
MSSSSSSGLVGSDRRDERTRRGVVNLILITLDTLRAQNTSLHGYHRLTTPHLDRLASKGVVFDDCYSTYIPTDAAHTTLFTGKDVFSHQIIAQHGKATLDERIPTLAEILKAHGYFTGAADFLELWFPRGFDLYEKYLWDPDPETPMCKAEAVNEKALYLIDQATAQDKPFFLWFHYWDPHSPYLPPGPFNRMYYSGDPKDPGNRSMDKLWDLDAWKGYFEAWLEGVTDIKYPCNLYDSAVSYMDAALVEVYSRLDKLGLLDDTLLVICSDHGEELDEHELWFDHRGLYDTNLWVPLVFHCPAKLPRGKRIQGTVTLIDVAPTILEILGLGEVARREAMEGRNLVPYINGKKLAAFPEPLFLTESTWMRRKGVRTAEWKLIVEWGGTPEHFHRPPVELYDLKNDPGEYHNLAQQRPDVVAMLRSQLEEWIKRRSAETGKPDPHENQGVALFWVTLPKGQGQPVVGGASEKEEEDRLAKRLRNLGYE